jgi:hypothetical protein
MRYRFTSSRSSRSSRSHRSSRLDDAKHAQQLPDHHRTRARKRRRQSPANQAVVTARIWGGGKWVVGVPSGPVGAGSAIADPAAEKTAIAITAIGTKTTRDTMFTEPTFLVVSGPL